MRVAVDVSKNQKLPDSLDCFTCGGPSTCVDTRSNSLIWYCQACDVFHETTMDGVKLRSFRKENSQIIVLPEVDDGAIS
jgi:transcription elongation factor Elf1